MQIFKRIEEVPLHMKYNMPCAKGNNKREEEIITYAFVIKSLEDKVRMTLQFSYLEFLPDTRKQ